MLISSSLVLLLVTLIFITIQLCLSLSWTLEDNQLTPLESGFESNFSSNLLSSPFYFLAILFVLFDMELILLFPSVLFTSITSTSLLSAFSTLVLVILLTLLLEWSWCGLKWQI